MEAVPFAAADAVDRFVAVIDRLLREGKLDGALRAAFRRSCVHLKERLANEERAEAKEMGDDGNEAVLSALIKSRQAARQSSSALDDLARKYVCDDK